MKSTIRLPKPHLSWSQIDLWNRSPQEYARKYFYGEEGFINSAMVYGKKFAEAMEGGEVEDEIMRLTTIAVPRYPISEYRLTAKLKTEAGDIPLVAYLDTAFDPPSEGLREYKTGVRPWTQKKVDNHKQLTIYALMVYLNENKLPSKMFLDWIETENVGGEISVTGKIVSFQTTRSIGDLMEMTTIIKRTAAQISTAYNQVLQSIVWTHKCLSLQIFSG